MTDPAQVCDELRQAIVRGEPNRGERLLLRAHQLGATPDMVLGAFMEEAVPRGVVDDHYLLYPNYAVKTCIAIGWEHAPWVLRTVVRYLSTVPPPAKDLVGLADPLGARPVGAAHGGALPLHGAPAGEGPGRPSRSAGSTPRGCCARWCATSPRCPRRRRTWS